MKKRLKQLLRRNAGGSDRTGNPSLSVLKPLAKTRPHSGASVYEYAWGWHLVRDDDRHWRGLVRFRGPDGVRVLLEYCPMRADFVGPNTHEVPPAERLRAAGHLAHQHYSFGAEVRA